MTMSIAEFKNFAKNYGFTGIKKENWHYLSALACAQRASRCGPPAQAGQAAKLPDGYKSIIDVIKAVGNWKG